MKKDCFVSIHTRNLWFLVVEIFKIVKGLELKIFCELFLLKEPKHYSLRHRSLFKIPRNKTVCNSFENISY